ncbi:uncharacterized protein LOC111402631 isoform X1 [Olea europaea var. sylvestris]|uniref:uncharacterized protein LOC111402631 isoform X1 n=1 Tax=Olea europaea var. sylvestris TaxID=158386 RepID=UPI000C1CE636|nr:uncharacterized protein LOC111402631 isoform X1 [Olea europaea var. sylvestris]
MGSFEEENLYQMVNDFLESESTPPLLSSAPQSLIINGHHAKYYILQEILESGDVAETDVLGSVMTHMRKNIDVEWSTTTLKKWLVKKLKIDGLNAALCHSTWPTTMNCPGGEYVYVEVIPEDKNGCPLKVIVDTDFKSQFELARPTSTYKELSNMVPTIFVGTEQKLKKIISILCAEARISFLERGLHVPPWRTSTYMQSKWFSACEKGQ